MIRSWGAGPHAAEGASAQVSAYKNFPPEGLKTALGYALIENKALLGFVRQKAIAPFRG
jgi:hypothetical protein